MFLTFDGVEEVEERVVGHLFGNSAHCAAAFVLLLLFNSFHRYVLPLVPVYLTARRKKKTVAYIDIKPVRGGRKGKRETCQVEADVGCQRTELGGKRTMKTKTVIRFPSVCDDGLTGRRQSSYPSQSMISGPSKEKGSEGSGSDFIL